MILEDKILIGIICLGAIAAAILAGRMLFIWKQLQEKADKCILNDWRRVREEYLTLAKRHGEKDIENVSYSEMRRKIKRYKKLNGR